MTHYLESLISGFIKSVERTVGHCMLRPLLVLGRTTAASFYPQAGHREFSAETYNVRMDMNILFFGESKELSSS